MILEEIEYHDWKITPDMSSEDRKKLSIEAYYLPVWQEKLKDITFNSYVYEGIESVPEYLPFEKSIVKYEHKSPKDSEFWGTISTKDQLLNLFYTSLRCKTNKGKYYCVREFKDLGQEYRCFWSNGLIAISSESEEEPDVTSILEYINKIASYIIYHRCVFDIAELKNDPDNKYIFVEFNSWESNSGAHRFDWKSDNEIFYSDDRYQYVTKKHDPNFKCIGLYSVPNVVIRWINGEKTEVNYETNLYVADKYYDTLTTEELFNTYKIVDDCNYLNTLFTEDYIYCSNDVWIGKFEKNTLKYVKTKTGVFRFNNLNFCEDGKIYDGENYYYDDLSPYILSKYSNKPSVLFRSDFNTEIKYGFILENKKNKQRCYLRLLSDFRFMLDLGTIKFLILNN